MPDEELIVCSAKSALVRLKEKEPFLVERLGEFFPDQPGFAWLDDYDNAFRDVFYRDAQQGGSLSSEEHARFWRIITSDPDQADIDELAAQLRQILGRWESADASAGVSAEPEPELRAETDPAAEPAPRMLNIAPVADYPGWWQGYDSVGGDWQYIEAAARPDDASSGWMTSSAAFATMHEQAAGAGVEPPGEERLITEEATSLYYQVLDEIDDEPDEAERANIYADILAGVRAALDAQRAAGLGAG